ncbi:MAG: DUF3368 domain-containing protein [Firmicutes bacterium]|nr:DUF3368 domain-containing protein [Bacillota bacterium]
MGATARERNENVRRIVSNTGPLLHLSEAQALDLLGGAGEIHVPQAVDVEMRFQAEKWQEQRPAWLIVDPLVPPHSAEAELWLEAGLLHVGEAEAIALARQIRADWLVTDDAAARLFAQTLGIEVHGSLGIVLWAAATGRLNCPEAEAMLDRLARSSLWLSPRVLAEAKKALEKIYS